MNILLIGCGRMGGAMGRSWKDTHQVFAYDPNAVLPDGIEQVEQLDPSQLPEDLVIVLAVKPQMFDAVTSRLQEFHRPDLLFVSLMAGVTLERLQRGLGREKQIVRTMPNTPAAIGRGVTAAFAEDDVGPAQRSRAEELLRAAGDVIWLTSESEMDVVTAVSGSGPAYFYRFTEALARAGANAGLNEVMSMRLARATFVGAAALAERREEDLSTLRTEVTSPGGTTAAGLAQMDESERLYRLLSDTVTAAANRSRELGS